MRTLAILPLVFALGCAHQKPEAKAQTTPTAPPPPVASVTGTETGSHANDDGSDLSACTSVRVHFAFNEADIDPADRDSLQRAARCLAAHRDVRISIAGNADERGTEEYNMALGDRRAHAVADYLRSLGASDKQVSTLSYGKERPLCSDHDEACWSQNRRAELVADNSSVKPHHKGRHK